MTVRMFGQMVRADLLKLGKKRSVTGSALVLTTGVLLAFYVYSAIAHATDPVHHGPAGGLHHFQNAFTTLGLDFGTIAAVLIGVEAGAGESADGTFRDLVVTGRSRLALIGARTVAAILVTIAVLVTAMAIAITMTYLLAGAAATPGAGLVARSVGWVLLCNTVVCLVAVGVGAVMGSRPAALVGLIAWQTIASRLLIDTKALGSVRAGVLDAALTKLMPGPASGRSVPMALLAAWLIALAWVVTAACIGARRTVTRDA